MPYIIDVCDILIDYIYSNLRNDFTFEFTYSDIQRYNDSISKDDLLKAYNFMCMEGYIENTVSHPYPLFFTCLIKPKLIYEKEKKEKMKNR